MARLVVDQKPDESFIFSYHYEYKDHLEYYGFIDPERAKRKDEIEKRKQAKLLEQQLDKSNKLATTVQPGEDAEDVDDENEGNAGGIGGAGVNNGMGDSNISGFDDDSASGMQYTGKNRFDTLLKSLIARIEFTGTLAPIQEYGRHQQKAAANNKKKKVKKPAGV